MVGSESMGGGFVKKERDRARARKSGVFSSVFFFFFFQEEKNKPMKKALHSLCFSSLAGLAKKHDVSYILCFHPCVFQNIRSVFFCCFVDLIFGLGRQASKDRLVV